MSVHHSQTEHVQVLQVFPEMANWGDSHKMTGVGSALKRHYQGLLLDYELAHPQDVNTEASM